MIRLYTDQGKDVVLLNTLIDANFISFLEYAEHDDKITFKRVDAAADGLTEDGETSEDERKQLETLFRAAVKDDQLDVQLKPFKADDMIAMITVDEQNRRFAEMSARWGGPEMNLPQKRTLLLNSKHPLVSWLEDRRGRREHRRGVRADRRSGRDGAPAAGGRPHGGVPQALQRPADEGHRQIKNPFSPANFPLAGFFYAIFLEPAHALGYNREKKTPPRRIIHGKEGSQKKEARPAPRLGGKMF